MFNFETKVKAFLQENFLPATTADATIQHTTTGLLNFLRSVYPRHGIDEFELYEMMHALGHKEQLYQTKHTEEIKDKKGNVVETKISYSNHIGWLLKAKELNVLESKS